MKKETWLTWVGLGAWLLCGCGSETSSSASNTADAGAEPSSEGNTPDTTSATGGCRVTVTGDLQGTFSCYESAVVQGNQAKLGFTVFHTSPEQRGRARQVFLLFGVNAEHPMKPGTFGPSDGKLGASGTLTEYVDGKASRTYEFRPSTASTIEVTFTELVPGNQSYAASGSARGHFLRTGGETGFIDFTATF